jgi:putative spermidine/putrescine transport system substrate-binding protein
MRLAKIDWALGAVLALMTIGVSACGSSSSSSTSAAKLPTSIGAGEGQLNLVAWEGYAQPEWVKPFEKQSGCVVHAKYAGSSDEMVTLMRQGGGSQYDLVSASGDASLRLIRGGDVAEMNVALVPDWKNFIPQLQSPSHNTVEGKHYGISLQWGPNILMYNPKTISPAPTSWAAIYDPKYKGQISVPNNPIQIADAALYLSKTKPSLGISDPYELTEAQLNAAAELLKAQRPLIKKYWALASDEIELFKNNDASIGAAWPYQQSTLQADKVAVKSLIPSEGATGWADTWMLAAHAKHPNCAYEWVNWVSSPKVQAEQALSYGETPSNTKACAVMETLSKGSCGVYHANAPSAYFDSIKFWKTPVKECGNGQSDCMDYTAWQRKWTEVTG